MKSNIILFGLFGLICSCDSIRPGSRISQEQILSDNHPNPLGEQRSFNRHKDWVLKDLLLISNSNNKFKRLLERTKWIELNYPLHSNPNSNLAPKQNSGGRELKSYKFPVAFAPLHSRVQKDLRLFVFIYSDSKGESQKDTLVQYEILTLTNAKILEINRMMPVYR